MAASIEIWGDLEMNRGRIIVVAMNNETGEIQLPMGDTALYGTGSEDVVLEVCCAQYDGNWTIALYKPSGDMWVGAKKSAAIC